jgi:hypothetical protein
MSIFVSIESLYGPESILQLYPLLLQKVMVAEESFSGLILRGPERAEE